MTDFNAYHFTADTLRDGRPIPAIGEVLVHDGKIEICRSGLHASECPLDALRYAPGNLLHRVYCEGTEDRQDDKLVCRKRTIIASVDATDLMGSFARKCALDAIHLWDASDVVREYLETGREDIRAAARAAAWAAGWAARDARDARDAAARAAWDAAARAAGDAAWAAGRAAADAQRERFRAMVDEAFA